MKNLWNRIKAIFRPEPVQLVPVVVRARRLDEAELRVAFAACEGTPLWDGVMQVLWDQYETVQGTVSLSAVASDPGQLAHAAGGQCYVGNLIAELQAMANAAKRAGN